MGDTKDRGLAGFDRAGNERQAVLAQARASYRAAVLTALEDVENALTSLGATRAQLNSLGEAHNAAQNALLLARQRWQAGLIDFGTLLDAQRSALAADNSVASVRSDEKRSTLLCAPATVSVRANSRGNFSMSKA